MKIKKIILAIVCVFMLVALTQGVTAKHVVSVHGTINWTGQNTFEITFIHGNTVTTEAFTNNKIYVMHDVRDGDEVVLSYITKLVEYTNPDGSIKSVWEKTCMLIVAVFKEDNASEKLAQKE